MMIGSCWQERIEAEKERGIGQREDQPVLRDDLHPRADRRTAGADPLDAEVAITEGRQHPAHASANRRRRLGLGFYSHVSTVTCLSNQARTKASSGASPEVSILPSFLYLHLSLNRCPA